MFEVEKAKEIVAKTAMKMVDEGLVVETWGNVSVRYKDNIVITPSGMDYKKLNFTDMVVMDFYNNQVEGKWKASLEYPMHRLIYQRREDVHAIVHTHSTFATTFAVARKEILPVVEDFAQVVGSKVAVADYAMPGTEKLAINCVEALKDKQAVLLANHGVVAAAGNTREAILICKLIERTALISLYAEMLGGAFVIEEKYVKSLRSHFLYNYGQK